jgi:hypothetical protein
VAQGGVPKFNSQCYKKIFLKAKAFFLGGSVFLFVKGSQSQKISVYIALAELNLVKWG